MQTMTGNDKHLPPSGAPTQPGEREPESCVNCGATPVVFINPALDYEYGVEWRSILVRCPRCGLVAQSPRVRSEDIPRLYPANYYVHGESSRKSRLYRALKTRTDNKKIRRLLPFLPRDGKVVEVGCGDGSFLRSLERARPDLSLIGVDIVDPGAFRESSVTFFAGQLENVDLALGSVDLIFFDDLLEHVENPVRFLEVCYGILKPGGVVFGITPDHASLDRLLFRKFWAGYHYPRHTFLFDHHNIRQILEKTRFGNIRVRGSNGLWIKSLKNVFVTLPATKKRGLLHYGGMLVFYPIDLLINLFMCHGEMSFIATRSDGLD